VFTNIDYKWIAISVIAVGVFAGVSDFQGMVVALPTIADHFKTDLRIIQWVVVGYSLTITTLLLPMGRLGDIAGRKRIYIFGFIGFVTAGFAAALSPSIEFLIGAKMVQGIGSAMTQGTAMAIVIRSFPEQERGKALGIQMSVVGIGGIAGPLMAGFLIASFDWPSVFYATSGLGMLAAAAALLVLKSSDGGTNRGSVIRFDWPGAILSAGTLTAFHAILLLGPIMGWLSLGVAASLTSFIGCIILFIMWESHTETPMLALDLFRSRIFAFAAIARYTAFIGMSSIRYLMPFYLQWLMGFGARGVGLILGPAAICMILTGPLSGRLADKYGWKPFAIGGLSLVSLSLGSCSQLDLDSHTFLPILVMIFAGCGLGIFNPANGSAIFGAADQRHYGVVSGFMNLLRNSGNVTGIAFATAIVSARMVQLGYDNGITSISSSATNSPASASFLSGLQVACLLLSLIVLFGVFLMLIIRNPRAVPKT